MIKKIKYSIVIPAYSEATIIKSSLKKVAQCLESDKSRHKLTEVIVVAADGPDNTAELALSQRKIFKNFRLIKPGPKVGKGRDVRAGVLAARGNYILFLDADMATPPHHIKEAFDKIEQTGADLLIADRPLNKIHNTLSRKIVSVLSNWIIRILATPGIKDTQCGFKVFKREVAHKLFTPLETLAWGFDVEVLVRARAHGYSIEFLKINDWHDPKEDRQGLVGESQIHAYMSTMVDLIKIAYKKLTRYYK